MGLKPVLPSWSKWHWFHILLGRYAVGYWHRHTCTIFPCCSNQLSGTLCCCLRPLTNTPTRDYTCQLHVNMRRHAPWAAFIWAAAALSVASLEGALFTFTLSLPGSEKSWNSTGLPVGNFVFCGTEKVICHHTAKELSYKNRTKYIFTSPTLSEAVILFAVSYFSCPPNLSRSLSHFLQFPFAPLLPALFYLLPNLVHDLIFWCNYLRNYSRAGMHLKAIFVRFRSFFFCLSSCRAQTSCSTWKCWSVCRGKPGSTLHSVYLRHPEGHHGGKPLQQLHPRSEKSNVRRVHLKTPEYLWDQTFGMQGVLCPVQCLLQITYCDYFTAAARLGGVASAHTVHPVFGWELHS